MSSAAPEPPTGSEEPPRPAQAPRAWARLRSGAQRLIKRKEFDRTILVLILLNSLVLAMTDYSVVDEDGEPTGEGSWRNWLVAESEPVFTALFVGECIVKLLALGVGGYLRDPWNDLDFTVVLAAVLANIPGVPNLSALRAFRVLRPLRSLEKVRGLKRLVVSLLNSLPGLLNVIVLLAFVFAIFGILGIKLWAGVLHARCRVTPFPVVMNYSTPFDDYVSLLERELEEGGDLAAYRCLQAANDDDDWTMETSPWRTPQDCVWPIAEETSAGGSARVCALGTSGGNKCRSGTTCGSNYDLLGNERFISSSEPYGYNRMWSATFTSDLNWGVTNFDHLGRAFLTVFQCITMEGWTDVMYQVQDAYQPTIVGLLFVVLILFGSFFMLNLVLAVISESVSAQEELEEKEAKAMRMSVVTKAVAEMVVVPRRRVDSLGSAADLSDSRNEDQEPPVEERASLATRIVGHRYFQGFVIVLIISNTVVLAMDRHPISEAQETQLETINFCLSCLFFVEMVLKLWGLGYHQYGQDPFNLFDAFIVCVSIVEVALGPPAILTGESGAQGGGGMSALRTFRLFRVFKLAREWKSLQVLLRTIAKTVVEVANFAVLLLLFMYIYALVGMQFFANKLHFDRDTGAVIAFGEENYASAEIPRNHFDDLLWAFVTIFQILTGENWNAVMYDCWRAVGSGAAIYFVTLVVFGGFIVMNLFLAILLGNFEGNEDLIAAPSVVVPGVKLPVLPVKGMKGMTMKGLELPRATLAKVAHSAVSKGGTALAAVNLAAVNALAGREGRESEVSAGSPDTKGRKRSSTRRRSGPALPVLGNRVRHMLSFKLLKQSKVKPTDEDLDGVGDLVADHEDEYDDSDSSSSDSEDDLSEYGDEEDDAEGQSGVDRAKRLEEAAAKAADDADRIRHLRELEAQKAEQRRLIGRSLFVFGPKNVLRMKAASLVRHKQFDNFILAIILVSSVLLAVENPLADPDSLGMKVLLGCDILMTGLFTLEMIVKIITMGLVFQRGAYLRSMWNVLDFVIVGVSIISLAASDVTELKSLRSLRTLRVLRPLRMISRRPGLKLVVNALFSSVPAIMNVLFVCLLFFLIFGIVGVNYFKGTFNSCQGDIFDGLSDDQVALLEDPVAWEDLSADQLGWLDESCTENTYLATGKYICGCLGAEWDQTVPQNFDNILTSLEALFEMSTTEGWVDIMYAAVDKTDIDMQPKRDNALQWVAFFVGFMLVGSFFVMNLFVGVVIDNFNRMKDANNGERVLLTTGQQEWVRTQDMMRRVKLQPRLDIKGRWRAFCFELYKHPKFDPAIMTCIIVNTLVMSAQVFGQPDAQTEAFEYLNYGFALVFTLEAYVKLTALHMRYFSDGWNLFDFGIVLGTNLGLLVKWLTGTNIGGVATVVRTFRVGRVVRLIHGAKSLRQLFNTLMLALPSLANIGGLLFLMYFIYAVMGVQLFYHIAPGDLLNDHAHFRNFWTAVLLLLRVSTGENWNGLMYAMAERPSGCVDTVEYDSNWCVLTDNAEGCTPLNGCGSSVVFPYFISFTLLVTFVMVNLFIGVVLDGFDDASQEEDATLPGHQFQAFVEKWSEFDPGATYYIKTKALFAFMQTLDAPMGFGQGHLATERELRQRIQELQLPIHANNRVHFADVSRALAHRALRLAHGDTTLDADDDQHLSRSMKKILSNQPKRGGQGTFSVASYYAASTIQNAYLKHKKLLRLKEASRRPASGRFQKRKANMSGPPMSSSPLKILASGGNRGDANGGSPSPGRPKRPLRPASAAPSLGASPSPGKGGKARLRGPPLGKDPAQLPPGALAKLQRPKSASASPARRGGGGGARARAGARGGGGGGGGGDAYSPNRRTQFPQRGDKGGARRKKKALGPPLPPRTLAPVSGSSTPPPRPLRVGGGASDLEGGRGPPIFSSAVASPSPSLSLASKRPGSAKPPSSPSALGAEVPTRPGSAQPAMGARRQVVPES